MREQMVLEERVIGVELNGNKKQFKWPVVDSEKKTKATTGGQTTNEDDDDESTDEMSSLQKTFVIHSAVLGVGAKADQRNLVQLTVKDSTIEKVILDQPILSLSLNKNDSISAFNLRLLLTDTTEITFKLVEGDGPVHLITSKVVEPPFDLNGYSSDDDEFDNNMSDTTDDELHLGGGGDKKSQLASLGKGNKKAKKQQLAGAPNSSNNNASSEVQQQKKKRKKNETDD